MPDKQPVHATPTTSPSAQAPAPAGPGPTDFGSNADRQADLGLHSTTPPQGSSPASPNPGTGSPTLAQANPTPSAMPNVGAPKQPTPQAELTRLWKEALDLYAEGAYQVALAHFLRLLREDPKKSHHDEYTWNAAQCYVQLGNVSAACKLFKTYMTMPGARAPNVAMAKQYIQVFEQGGKPAADPKKAASTIADFTKAQQTLVKGAADFRKAAVLAPKNPGHPWIVQLAPRAADIGQPYVDALADAKKHMTPELYALDQLLANVEGFASSYSEAAFFAVEGASNKQADSLTLALDDLSLLWLSMPPGMLLLPEPLHSYYVMARPKLLALGKDAMKAVPSTSPSTPATPKPGPKPSKGTTKAV